MISFNVSNLFLLTGHEAKSDIKKIVNNLPDCPFNSNDVGLKICKCDKTWQKSKKMLSSCSRRGVSEYLSQDLKSDIEISNLFSEAEQSKFNCSNQKHYLNYVGLIGIAKIGKTTLIKQLIQHYSETFEFVLYLNLQKVNYDEQTNLLNLFLPKNRKWQTNEMKTIAVLERMLLNPEKILIILDQLNTAKLENLFNNLPTLGYYTKSQAAFFILNILRGEIFIESKKVIVSRPYQYEKLHPDYRPKFVAYVVGLTKDMQIDNCNNENENIHLTFEQFHHQDIHLLCAVPMNCDTLINYYKDAQCIFTHTSLFADVFFHFCNVIISEASENICMEMLSKFAWSHFSEKSLDTIFFDLKDLKSRNLNANCIDSFFVTQIWKNNAIGQRNYPLVKYRFSSLLVQEFFVALKLLHLPISKLRKFLNGVLENFFENAETNSHNQIVILFLFGLCDERLNNFLSQFFPNFLPSVEILRNIFLREFIPRLSPHGDQNSLTSFKKEMNLAERV